MSINSETFVVDRRPEYPFLVSGNRYTPGVPPSKKFHKPGISLILLHAAGMHKETWEPVLQALFTSQSALHDDSLNTECYVEEAWSIEFPNHGQSAALNASEFHRFAQRQPGEWAFDNYSLPIHLFITSTPGGHDLLKRKLVGIGHSLGAAMLVLTIKPKIPFHSVILADAYMSPPSDMKRRKIQAQIRFSEGQLDSWPNREAAKTYFDSHPFSKDWTDECRELFVKYALIESTNSQASRFADSRSPSQAVSLGFSRELEIDMYKMLIIEQRSYTMLAENYRSSVPIHIIHCRGNPFKELQLVCIGERPHTAHALDMAHMFVQVNPSAAAALFQSILRDQGVQTRAVESKL
ncbi:hypothetical protein SISNIDRAFT_484707 [Sistotremastrum niveocremeum HHB9708]|uniref:AB hydrolase-1 domain-containing protein n=1 Tax=Sistotremastrum niveocremeum HHB9708 TaxID=1314777 RepID=A0A164VUW4_9AGAM|nr:hypothetical protein SISNIDRAFT_484707 [Sistotremastrum niveocremeum HHB9708]